MFVEATEMAEQQQQPGAQVPIGEQEQPQLLVQQGPEPPATLGTEAQKYGSLSPSEQRFVVCNYEFLPSYKNNSRITFWNFFE